MYWAFHTARHFALLHIAYRLVVVATLRSSPHTALPAHTWLVLAFFFFYCNCRSWTVPHPTPSHTPVTFTFLHFPHTHRFATFTHLPPTLPPSPPHHGAFLYITHLLGPTTLTVVVGWFGCCYLCHLGYYTPPRCIVRFTGCTRTAVAHAPRVPPHHVYLSDGLTLLVLTVRCPLVARVWSTAFVLYRAVPTFVG